MIENEREDQAQTQEPQGGHHVLEIHGVITDARAIFNRSIGSVKPDPEQEDSDG